MAVLWSATFPVVSRFERRGEPASLALPLRQGLVGEPGQIAVVDGDKLLPVQVQVTSRWPDHSIRWALVQFLVDLPGLAAKTVQVAVETEHHAPATAMTVSERASGMLIDTGALQFMVDTRLGFSGPQEVRPKGFDTPLQCGGIGVEANGQSFLSTVRPASWSALEQGPVRAVVEARGRLISSLGLPGLGYRARLYAWAHRADVLVEVTVFQDTEQESVSLQQLGLELRAANRQKARMWLGEANYQTRVTEVERGRSGERVIDADDLLYSGNEQVAETFHGDFFADFTLPRGGLTATIHQAHQQFPKALRIGPQGVLIDLLPRLSGGTGPITLPQGVSKTHRVMLHWHPAAESREEICHRSLQFQMPDQPVLPTEAYVEAGVWAEKVFPARGHRQVDGFALSLADERCRAYGWLHWGDGPDWGYTGQGRGRGALVWTNNEYDLPHAAFLHHALTGVRRFRDMAEVAARHWLDVDVVHHHRDASRVGAQIIHSANHVTGGASPCHEWVEGLLDTYHFTGLPEALEAAHGITRHVLHVLETEERLRQPGAAAARVTGWALRTLVAMYRETHDETLMAPADEIVANFVAWQEQYGGFLAPYHTHTLARVPFMIAIACSSLARYHQVRPTPRVAELIVAEMRALVTTCRAPDGRFIYKDLPSLHRRGAGVYVLEALAYAYDLSGDKDLLRAGLPELVSTIDLGGKKQGGFLLKREHYPREQAVVFGVGEGPKEYAAQWLPVMTFARALADADLLPPDPLAWAAL